MPTIMNKATNLLFTAAYSAGCLALWMVLALYRGIYVSLFHDVDKVPLSEVIIQYRLVIFLMPIPFILYSVVSLFRKPLTSEGIVFYVGIMAFVFMTLLLLVTAAVLLPMVPYQE